jgi:hypothetical protein
MPKVCQSGFPGVKRLEPFVFKTELLEYLYFGFQVRPWTRNISDALRKTPKWYLRDWSQIDDPGKRNETLAACHLLKAVEAWTDLGYGNFALWYVRDKRKREVDFLVTRDGKPWFLAEAKTSGTRISPSLAAFAKPLKPPMPSRSCSTPPSSRRTASPGPIPSPFPPAPSFPSSCSLLPGG